MIHRHGLVSRARGLGFGLGVWGSESRVRVPPTFKTSNMRLMHPR